MEIPGIYKINKFNIYLLYKYKYLIIKLFYYIFKLTYKYYQFYIYNYYYFWKKIKNIKLNYKKNSKILNYFNIIKKIKTLIKLYINYIIFIKKNKSK